MVKLQILQMKMLGKDVLILQVIWTFLNRSRSNCKYFVFNIQCYGKTSLSKEKKQVRDNLFQ